MIDRQLCKSCSACKNSCEFNAIFMKENLQGYLYAEINENICRKCNVCHRVCKMTEEKDIFNTLIKAFAAKSRNNIIRNQSRSGGLFYEFAKYVIAEKGVVYGAAIIDKEGEIVRVEQQCDLTKIRGSKYVWCEHKRTYKMVEEDLKKGVKVLYSGLPCQIAGLKAYLTVKKIDMRELILVDILCHGAASPKLFKDYVRFIEQRYGKFKSMNFRDKNNFGWQSHIETVSAGKRTVHSDLWTKIFYSHLACMNSCFYCKYKSTHRVGDISLGDCWNIEKTGSKLNDNKGASLVLINTNRGKTVYEKLSERVYSEPINIEDYMQPSLYEPVEKPTDYDEFWRSYANHGFEYVIRQYGWFRIKGRLRTFLKVMYYKHLRRLKPIVDKIRSTGGSI